MTDVDSTLAKNLVEFLGLTAAVGPAPERSLAFRLGVLYPYSGDLRRVYDSYVAVAAEFPDAAPLLVGRRARPLFELRDGDGASVALDRYVAAVDALRDRTGFASSSADSSVEHASTAVSDAIARAKRDGERRGGAAG
jgi:hypothetical protein